MQNPTKHSWLYYSGHIIKWPYYGSVYDCHGIIQHHGHASHEQHHFMDFMTNLTSLCLYGTVYDLHVFINDHK